MSKNRWVISDTHFGHANMLKFKRADGTPVRPEFSSCKEMDEYMVDLWNTLVQPNDIIYHLGDIAVRSSVDRYLPRLHGKKYLTFGNHDRQDLGTYAKYFTQARMWFVVDKVTLSHVPVHPGSLAGRPNIHGHIHQNVIDDIRYINVSVEQTKYAPVNLDEIINKCHTSTL